jgi:hypothetical protein
MQPTRTVKTYTKAVLVETSCGIENPRVRSSILCLGTTE